MQSTRWCYTLNNYTPEDEQRLQSIECKYHIYGRERGQSGTSHLQGFVVFRSRKRFNSAKSILGNQVHLEVARGTSEQAADYCRKDGDIFERGSPPSQGKRTDWELFIDWCRNLESAPTQRELIREFPQLWARYHQRMLDISSAFAPPPCLCEGNPREGWQADAYERVVDDTPDPRVIDFYVDSEGNNGKTWLAAFLLTKMPDKVQILKVGREQDMCYAIDESKHIFVIDVPRSRMEYFQYSVIEMLKDKMVFSIKYNSRMKILTRTPHVMVMCNEEPDYTKLSQDRYNVITIS